MLHLGCRIGITRNSESKGGTSVTTPDLFLGPAAGGEYYLNDQFSLGAEVGLFYPNVGTPTDNVSRSMISTDAIAYARINEETVDSPCLEPPCVGPLGDIRGWTPRLGRTMERNARLLDPLRCCPTSSRSSTGRRSP